MYILFNLRFFLSRGQAYRPFWNITTFSCYRKKKVFVLVTSAVNLMWIQGRELLFNNKWKNFKSFKNMYITVTMALKAWRYCC